MTTADAHIDNPRVLAGLSPRAREFRRFARVFFGRPVVAFGLVVIVVFLVVALFAPWIAPYDPNVVDVGNSLQAPSAAHPLGTDALGRDTLSRVVYGTRVSLVIGVGVVFFASIVGGLLGLAAGFMGGWIRAFIMRCTDALMAFPMILLALILIALTGGGLWNLMLALTISMLPVYIRLMCAQVLSLKESDYVTAARAAGSRRSRIMFRRILPNSFPPYIVLMTMMIGGAVLAEAGLSYLGLGISPPTATWGNMVSDGQQYLTSSPLLAFAPGLALMLAVFAFNMVGDGLRDALDPRLRGTL